MDTPILIVSATQKVMGFDLVEHFAHGSGASIFVRVCGGCGATRADTLRPVEFMHDEEDNVVDSGAPLCRPCSMRLPLVAGWVRAAWPALTASEVEGLWRLVRAEQINAMARQAARESATRTTFEGVEAALRAAILRGKTDTAIRTEIREAEDQLKVLRAAVTARENVTRELSRVCGSGE